MARKVLHRIMMMSQSDWRFQWRMSSLNHLILSDVYVKNPTSLKYKCSIYDELDGSKVPVTLNFDPWPTEFSEFILGPRWMVVPKLKKFLWGGLWVFTKMGQMRGHLSNIIPPKSLVLTTLCVFTSGFLLTSIAALKASTCSGSASSEKPQLFTSSQSKTLCSKVCVLRLGPSER